VFRKGEEPMKIEVFVEEVLKIKLAPYQIDLLKNESKTWYDPKLFEKPKIHFMKTTDLGCSAYAIPSQYNSYDQYWWYWIHFWLQMEHDQYRARTRQFIHLAVRIKSNDIKIPDESFVRRFFKRRKC
jgi:hypothetical protein